MTAGILALLAALAFALGSVLQQKGTLETSSGDDDPASWSRSFGGRSGSPARGARGAAGCFKPSRSTAAP